MPYKTTGARRAYQRSYYQQHKATIVNEARARRARCRKILGHTKAFLGCTDCGFREHPDALQWDHRDPATKLASVTERLWGGHWAAALEEMDKCDVRCANCHAIRTEKQRRAGII